MKMDTYPAPHRRAAGRSRLRMSAEMINEGKDQRVRHVRGRTQ